jgi:hypothetical protein
MFSRKTKLPQADNMSTPQPGASIMVVRTGGKLFVRSTTPHAGLVVVPASCLRSGSLSIESVKIDGIAAKKFFWQGDKNSRFLGTGALACEEILADQLCDIARTAARNRRRLLVVALTGLGIGLCSLGATLSLGGAPSMIADLKAAMNSGPTQFHYPPAPVAIAPPPAAPLPAVAAPSALPTGTASQQGVFVPLE